MPERIAIERLSAREQECLSLAAQGLSAKQISRQLGSITDQTVETYLKRARKKLGVTSSVAGGRLLEQRVGYRPPELDVPPAVVAQPPSFALPDAEDVVAEVSPSARSLGEERVEYRADSGAIPLSRWLPLRRTGAANNDMSFNAILGWTIGLPILGAIMLLIVAVAVAAVGLIWGGSISPHLQR